MELRARYKQTEVGVIPYDWAARELRELFTLRNGFAFSSTYFGDRGPIVLTPGNFKLEGGLYFNDRNTKRYSGQYAPSLQFAKGDLLIVMTDLTPSCDLLGKPAFVHLLEPVLHNQRIGKIVLLDSGTSREFLYWHFLSSAHAKRMKETATGSTVRHTSTGTIYKSLVAFPPTKAEQEAIASALSDADALIEALEQLIAKKRHIKQGAMQELLTGKKRLPGFSGEWGVRRLEELFNLSAGRPKSGVLNPTGRFVVMDMGSVSTDGKTIASKRTDLEQDLLSRGDLVMPKDDIGGGQIIGKVAIIDFDNAYVLGDHVYRLRKRHSRMDERFFYYLINSNNVNYALKKKVAGSAQLGLGRASVLEQSLIFPDQLTEQTAIATVLADMDDEIVALEMKLSKTRQIKQGMMHNLLTGRIRLI